MKRVLTIARFEIGQRDASYHFHRNPAPPALSKRVIASYQFFPALKQYKHPRNIFHLTFFSPIALPNH